MQTNRDATCKVGNEPIEYEPRMDLYGRMVPDDRPVTELMCLDCKLAAQGWTPYRDDYDPPPRPCREDWPTDPEAQRKRMIEEHNHTIELQEKERCYD